MLVATLAFLQCSPTHRRLGQQDARHRHEGRVARVRSCTTTFLSLQLRRKDAAWEMPRSLRHCLRALPIPDASMQGAKRLPASQGMPLYSPFLPWRPHNPLAYTQQPTALLSGQVTPCQAELSLTVVCPVKLKQSAAGVAGRSTSCRRSCRARQRRCCAATLQSLLRWTASQRRRCLATHLQARVCAGTDMGPDGCVLFRKGCTKGTLQSRHTAVAR